MSEEKKPRLAEVLGVEVGEKFRIADYPVDYGYVAVCADGKVRRVRPNPPLEHGDKIGANALYHIINQPECIKRRPRWTEQEVEDAKAILRIVEGAVYIKRFTTGELHILDGGQYFLECANAEIFPSAHKGEAIALDDIIGDNK